MAVCKDCGMEVGRANGAMLAHWQEKTAANLRGTPFQAGHAITDVCPVCDSYPLGVEMESGLPFYSSAVAAFVTVNDWDWWNDDPADCDIRQWPDFGCLTFSMEALESTVSYLYETNSPLLDSEEELPFSSVLLGPTGIPEDGNAETEWQRQLTALHSQMKAQFTRRELDVAVRRLVAVLV